MDNENKTLKVTIYGSEYTLRAKASDSAQIYQIAEYVDDKMREVQALKPNRPLHQIAILAALNIAEELFTAKKTAPEDATDFKKKIIEISNKLELGMKKLSEDNDLIRE